MNKNTRSRHEGLVGLDKLEMPITIIGVGSVGSFTALGLTKLGCSNVTLYDHDKVEEQNVGCQLYGEDDIGETKVKALSTAVKYFSGVETKNVPKKWSANKEESAIVICAVDTMKDRNKIWKVIKEDPSVTHYIDARMGGELMRLHTVNMTNPESMKRYETTLGVTPADIPCSQRSIVYNVFHIAGFITNQVKRIAIGQEVVSSVTFDIPTLTLVPGTFIK